MPTQKKTNSVGAKLPRLPKNLLRFIEELQDSMMF